MYIKTKNQAQDVTGTDVGSPDKIYAESEGSE